MKSDKQKSIFRAAARLFGEKGFEGTTLDKVAEAAGVAKGTIFYHFRSKEELFAALISQGVEGLTTGIEAIGKEDIGIERKLDRIIDFHFDFFKQNRDMCLMLLSQIGGLRNRWQKSIDLIRDRYAAAMEKIIREGKEQGVISQELETESLIITLFSLLAVTGVDWAIFHPALPEKQMAKTVKTLLSNGFIKR
jgi:AcrR family transcriptional regulator